MKKVISISFAGALALSLGACYSPGERAGGGALIGGATGAAIGAAASGGRAGGTLAGRGDRRGERRHHRRRHGTVPVRDLPRLLRKRVLPLSGRQSRHVRGPVRTFRSST